MDYLNVIVYDDFSCKLYRGDMVIIEVVKILFYIFLMLCFILGNFFLIFIVIKN